MTDHCGRSGNTEAFDRCCISVSIAGSRFLAATDAFLERTVDAIVPAVEIRLEAASKL
jgi:hypothetical protein